ncbi:MAG: chromosomal replication initiator protein DnaA [Bacteriovoracaceae bacterium]|nr:chromosomal replication initiator protein DnaA [Bacteriovoracaceae bacterium]
MNQDFPFSQFLKSDNNNQINNLNIENHIKNEAQTVEAPASQELEQFNQLELNAINLEIIGFLKDHITNQKFSTYFDSNFNLISIDNNKINFSVATKFIKTIIESQFLEILQEGLKSVLGNKNFEINILTKDDEPSLATNVSREPMAQAPKSANEAKFTLDLNPTQEDLRSKAESKYIDHMNDQPVSSTQFDPNKKFVNFVVGPSNNMAVATATAVAKDPGKAGKYPSLYIHSNSGLGKTHILHAVANEILDHYPNMRICLITARDFMKEMIDAIKDKNIEVFQNKYSDKVDVLMIDDIHELSNKKGTQDEFFHIFNELYNKGKQLIFTSDKSPTEIEGIEERIKTRLQWGLVIDIQKPDLETRIAILKKKAYDLDLFLSDDILTLIATSIKSNIRELEGSLVRLSAFADVMKVEIDTEMVKDLLGLENYQETKKITLDDIAKATSGYFKIPLADLKSKARNKEITRARHIAMYLQRKVVHATQQEIGRFFGGRDHTSVIHGVNKISEQVKTDVTLSRDLIQIETFF